MPSGIGQEFMEKTHYQYLGVSDQRKGIDQPPLQSDHDPDKPTIDLPAPEELAPFRHDLRAAIDRRKSRRRYAEQALKLDELAFLLWSTQGVREVIDTYATLRTVPSAGARHAFETYLLVNRVEGLENGLYRYLALEHQLINLDAAADIAERMTEACWDQTQVKYSAVTFFWAAVPYRMTWRYGERGYRYLHLDAGHVCQNLYLAAEAINAGVCAIAAFQDTALNQILGLDGIEQFVIYLATVGKRQE